jgi:hypothetical protein
VQIILIKYFCKFTNSFEYQLANVFRKIISTINHSDIAFIYRILARSGYFTQDEKGKNISALAYTSELLCYTSMVFLRESNED